MIVRDAAHELPRGVRLNAVGPGRVRETLGSPAEGTPAAQVARAYADLAEGDGTGQVVRV